MQFGKEFFRQRNIYRTGFSAYRIAIRKRRSGFNQRLHFHDFYELSLIYEGSSRFLINGSAFVAAAGSLQLIRPSDYHRQMTDTGNISATIT